MSNHTPGPWTAHNFGPHWNNPAIDNWTIHYGADQEHVVDHVYLEADARLIAAAPALLHALRGMVDHAYHGVRAEHWRKVALAAIASAEGRE